jgi:hypothetical protein
MHKISIITRLALSVIVGLFQVLVLQASNTPLRVGVFEADASPPVGSPLAYNRCEAIGMPLSARGVVILGSGAPIVLCAVDWIGISNAGHHAWREALAKSVGTSIDRVTVHTLHQHDAPRCDFSVEAIMHEQGMEGIMFDAEFAHLVIQRTADALSEAAKKARDVTHLGLGRARVESVASNRRILGANGKVRATRYTACRDPVLRAEPVGVIDPFLKSISFWDNDELMVVLTWYATHPQSYYLTGIAHPDFPGMARFLREATLNGVPHVHFNGAGGNVGAGKYNDGSRENRQALSVRLAEGMSNALTESHKIAIQAEDVHWQTLPVALPVSRHLQEAELIKQLEDPSADPQKLTYVAKDLVWLRRCLSGEKLDLHCLSLGSARILFMPGELSVEYQLAAQEMWPGGLLAMAAYGEYAPGYICTAEQYTQGGYEDSPRASKVAPEVENVLLDAMRRLLHP